MAGPARSARTTALPSLFAALAGAASALSFAPFGWWPVEIAALAFLFYQVGMDTSVRRSSLLGWAFGFGWTLAGTHWVYITMNRYGSIPAPLAAGAACLLALYLGLFAGLATGFSTWLRKRYTVPVTSFLFLVLPFSWGLSEWMRGWVVTGFPWVASGYAQNNSPLAGYAPLVGVYGVGVLVALCASAIAMLTQKKRLLGGAVLGLTLAAGYALTFIAWTHPEGKPISVRLVQGNIEQREKFDPAHTLRALNLYHDLLTAAPADLIALPETAITVLPQFLPPDYLESYKQYAASSGSYVMFGIPLSDGPGMYANSVAAYGPDGQSYRFDKQHLVPFGEFVPYGFRWFVTIMRIPLGEMTRGPLVQAPFAVKDQLVLPNVCYEDVFGEEIALQLRSAARPATILLNASNLAWFGESIAVPQHLQISQMRALETGRPMLRSTNSGATAVIDGRGKVVSVLPYYAQGTLAAQVQGMAGMTPFIRFGNYAMLALSALALLLAAISGRKYAKTPKK
ncbi:MAG: apolipoprotein N-acyltransferase [Pseudomonadota bacterium]